VTGSISVREDELDTAGALVVPACEAQGGIDGFDA
jgi:hypothetical protein